MKTFKIIWIIACLSALVFSICLTCETYSYHSNVYLGWFMIILTFPSGLLFMTIAGWISDIFFVADLGFVENEKIDLFEMNIELSICWLGLFIVGYIQWFWLFPKLYKKTKLYLQRRKSN